MGVGNLVRSAYLFLGGVGTGVALTILVWARRMSDADARLRAIEARAQHAEQRARAAAEEDLRRADTARAAAVAITQRDEDVAVRLAQLRSEWSLAPKNASGRIDRPLFKEHYVEAHADQLTQSSRLAYEEFLDRCFDAAVGLMLAPGMPERPDLGRHCFSYAALLADEFYFEAAANASGEQCSCMSPVADSLALATPCKSR